MKVPFQIIGGAYKNPTIPANFQRCVNWYPTTSGSADPTEANNPLNAGRNNFVLLRTAGCLEIGTIGPSVVDNYCRGLYQIETTLGTYLTIIVIGTGVYNLNFNYTTLTITPVLLGNLTTYHGIVSISSNPTQIIFTCYDYINNQTGGSIYNYVTNTFSTISDVDFGAGSHVCYIDGYFFLNNVAKNTFYSSDLNNGLSYNALNVATAESKPDVIVGLGATKGELFLFGAKHIEDWFDNGNSPGMPFSKRVGMDMDIGCSAPMSITTVNGNLLYIDNRRFVVESDFSQYFRNQNTGFSPTKLSSEAIDTELAKYSKVNDALGATYNDNGHIMYELTFPSENKTWVYDTTISMWHERSSFNAENNSYNQSLTNFYVQNEQYILAASLSNNSIYLVSRDYLTDDGNPIHRIRTTKYLNKDFCQIGIDELEVKCDVGLAPIGDSPSMTLRFSNDSGHTWSYAASRSLGLRGQYGTRVNWNCLGSAYEWLFEFTVTDPVDVSIIDCSLNLNIGDV